MTKKGQEKRTINMNNFGCDFNRGKNLKELEFYCPFCNRTFLWDEHHQHSVIIDGKEDVDVKLN